MTADKPQLRRCAVYTRKSSEEGLEQEFNSLHAQREACEAFIRSQTGEGWRLVDTAYDDGGLSGGTMERPALRKLLADIAERRIDIIVVYKVDRLTRSLMDFARMVELFDRHSVSFVAVTQQFNTTTSMGRLTLNILLSFAQFEREVTGERIRDKIAASKKKGMWMGGVTPLGYDVKDRSLVIVPAEAETVRLIYQRYLDLGSVRQLKGDLDQQGVRSKIRTPRNGARNGGNSFARGALYAILSNPIYIGEIVHKGVTYPGKHEPIVDRHIWSAVQQHLKDQYNGNPARKAEPSPLFGKLFDEDGARLTPSHAVKQGRRYRYYVSPVLLTGSAKKRGQGWRLPATQIEQTVAREAAEMLADHAAIAVALGAADTSASDLPEMMQALETLRRQLTADASRADSIARLITRVDLRSSSIAITLTLTPLLETIVGSAPPEPPTITREILLRIKRRGVEMRLIAGKAPPGVRNVDLTLLKEIRRGHRSFRTLLTERLSIATLAKRENVNERYIAACLPLAFLAPDIVEAIINGRQSPDLTATNLICRTTLALDWDSQKKQLGFD